MDFEIKSIVQVSPLKEIPALQIIWTRPVDPETACQVYGAVLQEMKQRNIKHLVFDIRNQGQCSPEGETWLFTEFVPQLISAFGSHISLAYVLQKSHYNQLVGEGKPERLENYSEIFRINYFTSRKEAVTWITDKLAA